MSAANGGEYSPMSPNQGFLAKAARALGVLAVDAAILLVVTCSILVFVYLFDGKPPEGATRAREWVHRHCSDILLALVVAWLALVVVVGEKLKGELKSHRAEWAASCLELRRLKEDLVQEQHELADKAHTIDNILRHAQTWATVRDRASKAGAPEIATAIFDRLNESAVAWSKRVCQPLGEHDGEATRKRKLLESLCWRMVFEAYMGEELADIKRTADRGGPILATNYPTYLNFLDFISEAFVKECQRMGFKPCIVALANAQPAEWVMVCERVAKAQYLCAADKHLSTWRATSRTLGKTLGSRFRRVFVTAADKEIAVQYGVPLQDEFKKQLGMMVVYDTKEDPLAAKGLFPGVWRKIEDELKKKGFEFKAGFEIRTGKKGFKFTVSPNLPQTEFIVNGGRYTIGLKPLKEMCIREIHGDPYEKTAQIVLLGDAVVEEVGTQRLKECPSDFLVIGILKDAAHSGEERLIPNLLPLLAIECKARVALHNICLLRLYGRQALEKADGPMAWLELLERQASPIV